MTAREMADAMLEKVRDYDHVSFAELSNLFGDDAKGNHVLEIFPNVVLWSDVSEQFVEACKLMRPEVEMTPASPLVYMIDGGALRLPIAKNPTKRGYKKPHWLPVTLSPKKEAGR
jgi:hypothetical protein